MFEIKWNSWFSQIIIETFLTWAYENISWTFCLQFVLKIADNFFFFQSMTNSLLIDQLDLSMIHLLYSTERKIMVHRLWVWTLCRSPRPTPTAHRMREWASVSEHCFFNCVQTQSRWAIIFLPELEVEPVNKRYNKNRYFFFSKKMRICWDRFVPFCS